MRTIALTDPKAARPDPSVCCPTEGPPRLWLEFKMVVNSISGYEVLHERDWPDRRARAISNRQWDGNEEEVPHLVGGKGLEIQSLDYRESAPHQEMDVHPECRVERFLICDRVGPGGKDASVGQPAGP